MRRQLYSGMFLAMLFCTTPIGVVPAFALSTTEKALIDLIREANKPLAEELEAGLKSIEGERLSEEEERTKKQRFAEEQITNAEQLRDAARKAGLGLSDRQARLMDDLFGALIITIRDDETLPLLLFPILSAPNAADRTNLRIKYSQRLKEIEEREAKKSAEAELNKGDGIAPEHSSTDGGKPEISVALGGGIGGREVPRQRYLATEFGGLLDIGVLGHNRDVTVTGWDVAVRYAGEFSGFRIADENSDRSDAGNFFNPGNLVHELKFGGSHGSSSESFDDFDPGAGVGLGIPGTGDGTFPAGIFLLDLPGASNDVIGSWGRFEVDSFEAGYRGGYEIDAGAGFSLQPFVGLGYRHTSEKQSFGGSIPGYGIDFEYDTRLRFDAFKTEIGARLEHQLSDTVSIFGEPSVSLNFIDLDGWDGLELTGLVSDSQRVDLDRNEIQPGVKLAVGFDWEPVDSPFSVYAGAVVAHEPTTATVFRSGETGDKSKADVEHSTLYEIYLSLKWNP